MLPHYARLLAELGRSKEKCLAIRGLANRGLGSPSQLSAARRILCKNFSSRPQYPRIAVWLNATRATTIECRQRSRKSGVGTLPSRCGRRAKWEFCCVVVVNRRLAGRGVVRYRREALCQSGYVPVPVPQSTFREFPRATLRS